MNTTMMKQETSGDVVALHAIEARIVGHMHGIAYNLLEVGRCLVEAKDAKLVPHGSWENWVRTYTGMSESQAQRLMRAARNAPEGSAMAQLPVSHILALLPLPPEQREVEAAAAAENGATVQQLRDRVDELQRSLNSATRQATNMLELKNQMAEAKEAAEERERSAKAQVKALEEMLDEARDEAANREFSPVAQQEIERLKRELADAQEYAARQATLRQQAQQEMLDAQINRYEPEPVRAFGVEDLAAATQAFIGAVGVLPMMGAQLSRMPTGTREDIRKYIDTVSDWAWRANKALEVVEIEG